MSDKNIEQKNELQSVSKRRQQSDETLRDKDLLKTQDLRLKTSGEGITSRSFGSHSSGSNESDEQNNDFKNKEIEKRAKLDARLSSDLSTSEGRDGYKSTPFNTTFKELPTDIRSALLWINVIATVLSIVLLTAVVTQSKEFESILVISLIASIIGQTISWIGAYRSLVPCLAISVLLLIIQVISGFVVTIMTIMKNFETNSIFVVIFLGIVICFSISTIILIGFVINSVRSVAFNQTPA